MTFRDLLRDTIATLWAHKRRTLLTMFGIAWGIISITVMVAAGEGLGRGIQKQQENFGKDVMIIFAGRTSMQAGGTRSGRVVHWMEDDYQEVAREAPACKYVMPELGNNVKVHSAFNSGDIDTVGSLPPFAIIRSVAVEQGRFYNDEDNEQGRRVAFLGSDTKKQLFAEREALGHTVDRILAAPWSLETHSDCVRQIRRTLARLHNFDPRDEEAASIWDTVKKAQANRMIFVGMEVFMGAVGVATIFLGGLGVMNVMLVSVRERTREIGVRKALGATRESILHQFFLETIFVVVISGGAGLIISYGFCALVNLLPKIPYFDGLDASWKLAALTVSLLGVIAVLSALYPANQAASVDPIEALRFEAGG